MVSIRIDIAKFLGMIGCFYFFCHQGFAQKSAGLKYEQEILKHRAHEDSLFKHSEKSPLMPEAKTSFTALEYFPINEAYRVKAKFVRTANEGVFKMPTTGPRTPEYVKYGELHFNLNGQKLQLNAYQNQDLMKQVQYANYLFIPFTDATTGQETYATGRYLDFSIPISKDSVWIDFNKAYNPYCAYSDGYSCPIPPKENKLPIRIEAGVKNYEKEVEEATSLMNVEGVKSQTDVEPEFQGGKEAMYRFLGSQLKMPKKALKEKKNGTVLIGFMVKTDGSLQDFKILKSMDPEVDQAILKAAMAMPKWKPAMKDGKPMDSTHQIPYGIRFL